MKSIGVIRRVDELGRIVIPKELRESMGIKERVKGVTEGEAMEIFVDDDQIVLKKYQPGCYQCGSLENVHTVGKIRVCKKCAEKIAKAVE